ncbi:MAG: hypothetical protein PHP44_13205 [Kiritimatiellae bacterium]|nr:hypothetical protein [Kiritimatiellia bacterium]
MKQFWNMALLGILLTAPVFAEDEYLPGKDRFQVCNNKSGGGFYWVDSTTGDAWLMDSARKGWNYCGKPEGAPPAEIGTYLPYPNRNGRGVFVLNTSTGEGWYYDSKTWTPLGKPQTSREAP